MSLLDHDFDSIEEPVILPEGTEVTVRVSNVNEKDESHCMLVWFSVVDHKNTPEFSHLISLPNPERDTESQQYRKLQDAKAFAVLIGANSFDIEDWLECEVDAILGVRQYNGKDQNFVQSFVTAG